MKMESLFKKALLSSSLSLLLAACGQPVDESPEVERAESQAERLELEPAACEPADVELIEESCFHAENGPYVAVSAAALGSTTLPNVNLPHTAYNITLPSHPTYQYAGSVTYRPVESGEYAFSLSRRRAFKIYDGNTVVSKECSYFIDDAACAGLKRMVTADLEAGKVYRLEFKALHEQNASFTLVVEEAAHHDHEE